MQLEDGNDHGFLLRDGKFTQIDFPNATTTTPRGVNNAGDITGNFGTCIDCESGFILGMESFTRFIFLVVSPATYGWHRIMARSWSVTRT
jgi:hypothetical protein